MVQASPMFQFRGIVYTMSLGPADTTIVTIKSAKMSAPAVFEMTPEQAKNFAPGMRVLLQVGQEFP